MRINVKGEKRDQLRRERYHAITKRERVVAGVPIKQFYPCYNEGKYVSRKCDELKHGERRRISIACNNARYEHDAIILDDPSTAITRLFKTSNYFV